jgi:hypothetical protein
MMQPPKWTEYYNCHELKLMRGAFRVNVDFLPGDNGGYKVSVNSLRMKGCVKSLDEAKRAGVDLVTKMLEHATHELNLLEKEQS